MLGEDVGMSDIKPIVKRIKVAASWRPPVVVEGDVDGFPVTMDQPERIGGTNTAPGPLQLVTAALVGCAGQTLALVARQTGFRYASAKFEAEGDVDVRGFLGEEGICRHFCDLRGTFIVETEETEERFREIVAIVEDRCPIYCLFRDAGVPMGIEWERK